MSQSVSSFMYKENNTREHIQRSQAVVTLARFVSGCAGSLDDCNPNRDSVDKRDDVDIVIVFSFIVLNR